MNITYPWVKKNILFIYSSIHLPKQVDIFTHHPTTTTNSQLLTTYLLLPIRGPLKAGKPQFQKIPYIFIPLTISKNPS